MLKSFVGALGMGAALLLAQSAVAERGGEQPLTELVRILHDEGVLDEADYEELTEKAEKREQQRWLDGIELWGDFRARYESVHYDSNRANDQRDANGDRFLDDQIRYRYRLRFNVKADVNEYSDVFFRLTTGRSGRTTNETLGSNEAFDTDEIFLDKAYARFSPFARGELPQADGSLWFHFGRTHQPWRWDNIFKDWLLWDDELSPAGFYGDAKLRLSEKFRLSANAGVYYIDENSTSKDPKLLNAQLALHREIDPRFDVGARATWFNLSSLDGRFIDRGISLGNTGCSTVVSTCTAPGLTGDRSGGSADVVEFGAYAKARLIERWPMLFLADIATNLDASSATVVNADGLSPGTFRASEEDLAWLVAFQIGDAKEVLRFRTHYAWLEANSFPAQFVDSDLFDGRTNRKGWVWDVTKTVMRNTDASVTAFLSEPIEESGGYQNSQAGSERFRIQANMVWKF